MRITETSSQTRFSMWTPGQDMTGIYPVQWRALFASLSVLLSLVLTGCVALVFGARFVSTGFDMDRTFEHASPQMALLLMAVMPVLAVTIAFLVAMLIRLARITVTDRTIQGVNYWGLPKTLPLGEITKLGTFSQQGVHAIVVHARRHGTLYISDKTCRLSELIQFLEATIVENEKVKALASQPLGG